MSPNSEHLDNEVRFCRTCGRQLQENESFCPRCGASIDPAQPPPISSQLTTYVPNYLAQAILVTIFGAIFCTCFSLPAGIVAIVFSSQVNGRLAAGDYNGAVRASTNAKTWCWVGFGLMMAAVVIWIVYLFLVLVLGIASIFEGV